MIEEFESKHEAATDEWIQDKLDWLGPREDGSLVFDDERALIARIQELSSAIEEAYREGGEAMRAAIIKEVSG